MNKGVFNTTETGLFCKVLAMNLYNAFVFWSTKIL